MKDLDTTVSNAILHLVVGLILRFGKTSFGDFNKTICVFCNSTSLPIFVDETSYA